jgi:pimeloyl-ACP methyl ester carboxylesterase
LLMKLTNKHILKSFLLVFVFLAGCGGSTPTPPNSTGGSNNEAPVIISPPDRFAKENIAYIYKVNAVDKEGNSLTFALATAPKGMEINPGTGTISWVPTSLQGGRHSVKVQVSDGKESATQDYIVAVETSAVVAPKFISASTGGTVDVTDPISPIFGTKVEIPPGLLPQDATITISSVSFAEHMPETVPVFDIKGDLLDRPLTKGINRQKISSGTQILVPFPKNDGSFKDEELKLYRWEDNCYIFETPPHTVCAEFVLSEKAPIARVSKWNEVSDERAGKSIVNRTFTYTLTKEESVDLFRKGEGKTVRIAATDNVKKSSLQVRFFETVKGKIENFIKPKDKEKNLILVHGVLSSSDEFRDTNGLIEFFKKDNYYSNILFYNYPWAEEIPSNANAFASDIEKLGAGSVDIIAHSMGGAVARWAIEDPKGALHGIDTPIGENFAKPFMKGIAPRVGHLFMLATPNWGVDEFIRSRGKYLWLPWGTENIEDSGLDNLIEGSEFLKDINNTVINSPVARRGQAVYHLYTARTHHGTGILEDNDEHPTQGADHISATSIEFVPVPTDSDIKLLGLQHPPNEALTFGNQDNDVKVGDYKYNHSTIHNQCSKNGVCDAIIAALNRSSTVTPIPPSNPDMSGTLSLSPTSCVIESGASSCNVSLTWSTTNPVGVSAVTSEYPNANYTVATGNAGSTTAPVPYSSRNFYLYNNAQILVTGTATASCAAGTTWNGSTCQAPTDTPPDTIIDGRPDASTASTSATFIFHSTENGSTFECKLDSGHYSSCISPKSYSGLTVGSHTFSVRAKDAAGNIDLSSATHSWTVITEVLGTGPYLSVTPSNLDFGSVDSGSPVKEFIVTNSGGGTLTGNASISGSSPAFSILGRSLNYFNLGAGQSFSVEVMFKPIAVGPASAQITFNTNAGSATRTVSGSAPSTGSSISVFAGLDGNEWEGPLNFNISGPSGFNGSAVPTGSKAGLTAGTYTAAYVSGGPPGAIFTSVTLVNPSVLEEGKSIIFIFNFSTKNSPVLFLSFQTPTDFGNVPIGETRRRPSYVLSNSGTGTLSGTITLSPPFSIWAESLGDNITANSFNITSGVKKTLWIQFAPTSTGALNDIVTITSNGGNASLSVRGVGGTLPTKPIKPSNLTATDLSSSRIAVSWRDMSDNEDGFKIERGPTPTGAFSQIKIVGQNESYFEDSGLLADTIYCYRVRANNTIGDSDYSDKIPCATPLGPIISDPPITGVATSITPNSATLNGTVNPNGVSTSAYFDWGTSTSYGKFTPSQYMGSGSSSSNISANLTGLSPNTTYHFRAVAANTSGSGGTSHGVDRFFTTSPLPPNLTVVKSGSGNGTITFSPTGTSCGQGCYTYQQNTSVTLYASPSSGSTFGGWSEGGCSGTGSCTVTLTSGNTSVYATFNTPIPPPMLLNPTNGATLNVGTTYSFTWASVSGATSYDFEFDNGNNNGGPFNNGGALARTYKASSGCGCTGPHTWRVRGVNSSGPGQWSTAWSFNVRETSSPPPAPMLLNPTNGATLNVGTTYSFTWASVSGATSYDFEFDNGNNNGGPFNNGGALARTYKASSGCGCTGPHTWRVRGVNSSGPGPWSTTRSFTVR